MASHSYPSHVPSASTRTLGTDTNTESEATIVYNPPTFANDHRPPTIRSSPDHYASSPDVHHNSALPNAPTPPSILSDNEIYGPQRVHGSAQQLPPVQHVQQPVRSQQVVQFAPAPAPVSMTTLMDPSIARDFKDDLVRAAGRVTPGVDDGPYIAQALELMTRPHVAPGEDDDYDAHESSQGSGISYPGIYHSHSHSKRGPPVFQPAPAYIPENANETRRSTGARPPSQPPMSPVPMTPMTPPARLSLRNHLTPTRGSREQNRPEFTNVPLDHDTMEAAKGPDVMEAHQPLLAHDELLPRDISRWRAIPDISDAETGSHNHSLTHKPRILQTPSLLGLIALSAIMVVLVAFSAGWSRTHDGLTMYSENLYNGEYFLFRVLPQLLGAVVLIYWQCVTTVAYRMLPFSQLASDDARERERAVFQPMYMKSFLWPQSVRDWKMAVMVVNTWLLNFTIPLLSTLFTVVLRNGQWTWAAGQGVAWTLVALYGLSTLSAGLVFLSWRRKRTGLRQGWDLRSIADFLLLAAQSNSASKYRRTEVMATRDRMRDYFSGKDIERLGFWDAPDSPKAWYGLGVEESIVDEKLSAKLWARGQAGDNMSIASRDSGDMPIAEMVRSRYLPWCFRTGQVVFAAVAAVVLVVALIIVCSTNTTNIRQGFLPGVGAGPNQEAFSSANFLWGFVPSLLGMLLFLVFQSYDVELRILAPWGELARADGSRAETSLLLDYAAATMPWEATFKAIKNRHWRVAFVSFMAPTFILIPVLAGGMFIALTKLSNGEVRMFPQIAVFGVMLALLCVYAIALVLLVPNRDQFRLPHAVSCLAEILSFCSNDEIRNDTAFTDVPITTNEKRSDLKTRLDCGQDWHRQGRWTFSYGRNNDERLGIKRYSRFTVNPRKLRQYDRRTRGELISQPQEYSPGHSPQHSGQQQQQQHHSRQHSRQNSNQPQYPQHQRQYSAPEHRYQQGYQQIPRQSHERSGSWDRNGYSNV